MPVEREYIVVAHTDFESCRLFNYSDSCCLSITLILFGRSVPIQFVALELYNSIKTAHLNKLVIRNNNIRMENLFYDSFHEISFIWINCSSKLWFCSVTLFDAFSARLQMNGISLAVINKDNAIRDTLRIRQCFEEQTCQTDEFTLPFRILVALLCVSFVWLLILPFFSFHFSAFSLTIIQLKLFNIPQSPAAAAAVVCLFNICVTVK